MARNIAILNHKGGVGKTTTAINLGAALNILKQRVLIIDLDPQCNATYIMGFDEGDGETVFDALIDKTFNTPLPTYEHQKGLDICPASRDLGQIDLHLNINRMGAVKVLRKLMKPLQDVYDYIIIDCPPNIDSILTVNAMTAANELIVPINRQLAVLGMVELNNKIADVKEENEDLHILGFLLTDYKRMSRAVKETKSATEAIGSAPVLNARIRNNDGDIPYMVTNRQTLYEFSPHCIGAEDYMHLACEISGKRYKG